VANAVILNKMSITKKKLTVGMIATEARVPEKRALPVCRTEVVVEMVSRTWTPKSNQRYRANVAECPVVAVRTKNLITPKRTTVVAVNGEDLQSSMPLRSVKVIEAAGTNNLCKTEEAD